MTVRDGAAETAGIATGQAAAWATMNRRQGDGAETATQPAYVPISAPGEYQFTAPFALRGAARVGPRATFRHSYAAITQSKGRKR